MSLLKSFDEWESKFVTINDIWVYVNTWGESNRVIKSISHKLKQDEWEHWGKGTGKFLAIVTDPLQHFLSGFLYCM